MVRSAKIHVIDADGLLNWEPGGIACYNKYEVE
jgi:hypothetical protein